MDEDRFREFTQAAQARKRQLRHEMASRRLRFRSVSPGYWAALLLPVAIYFSIYDTRDNNKGFMIALFIVTFNSCLLAILHIIGKNLGLLLQKLTKFNIALSIISILYCLNFGGNLYELTSFVVINFSFPYVFYNFIRYYPRSFSFGEGLIMTTAFAYTFWIGSQVLPHPPHVLDVASESNLMVIFIYLAYFSFLLIARVVIIFIKPWKFFIFQELFCLWAKSCLVGFSYRLRQPTEDIWFLIKWPVQFLFKNSTRVHLLLSWATLCGVAVFFVLWKNYFNSSRASTIDRKYFHFLISAVYTLGILMDLHLLYFCSVIVLFVFLLVEVMRFTGFEVFGYKIGRMIDSHVGIFRDRQDEGKVILTPIYLLVGCSLPVWLTRVNNNNSILSSDETILALSGVLSIGIGDTFASIGGSKFGRHRWKDSPKTVEGTMSSLFAQFLAILALTMFGLLQLDMRTTISSFVAILSNVLIEAKTDQIDNLVVPLVTYNVMKFTHAVIR